MRERLLDLIVCPKTGQKLELQVTQRSGPEIFEGRLLGGEGTSYPITRGVPRFVPDDLPEQTRTTVERFGQSWSAFDFIGEHYRNQFLKWIEPNPPETFQNKIVLEGGCGKGRHARLVSEFGAKDVIAVDLGSAVDVAFRNTAEYENIHVVQADLFCLPVADRSVDVGFSLGVLHHTPEPRRAFSSLSQAVKPGGRVIAWVYGRENNGWIVHGIDPLRKGITSRLSHKSVFEFARLPAALLYLLGKGVYLPLEGTELGEKLFYREYMGQIARFPFKEIHHIVHDHLTPPIAFYIREEEFRAWFQESEFRNTVITWHNQNSWRGTAIRRA